MTKSSIAVSHIPEGLSSVTPFLLIQGALRLIDFMKQAFNAVEIERSQSSDGIVHHATVCIEDTAVEIAEAHGRFKPLPTAMHLYVPDVDAVYKQAIATGGVSIYAPVNQFYGDREAGVEDPSGNQWFIATHQEDVSEEEMRKREQAFLKEEKPEDELR